MEGPQQILQLLSGAQATSVLSSAIELGFFPAIKENGSLTAIAKKIGCPERSTRIVLSLIGEMVLGVRGPA